VVTFWNRKDGFKVVVDVFDEKLFAFCFGFIFATTLEIESGVGICCFVERWESF